MDKPTNSKFEPNIDTTMPAFPGDQPIIPPPVSHINPVMTPPRDILLPPIDHDPDKSSPIIPDFIFALQHELIDDEW